jgi:hypothetical protein
MASPISTYLDEMAHVAVEAPPHAPESSHRNHHVRHQPLLPRARAANA